VDEVIVVSDADTVAALFWLLERTKYLLEPAAACCLAAAERRRAAWRPGEHIVLLACGGNVAVQDLCAYHARFAAPPA